MKGLKTKDFLTKMPKNLAFLFLGQNGQNLAQCSRKWRKKNQIGENGGERKKILAQTLHYHCLSHFPVVFWLSLSIANSVDPNQTEV